MKNNTIYYLIVNNDVFKHSDNLDELVNLIVGFGIHTKFYGEKIDSEKKFWEYFDKHEGILSSFDEILDSNNTTNDIIIIEEFYVNQYNDIKETVNRYREEIKLPPLE